jgi:hypothetical protein
LNDGLRDQRDHNRPHAASGEHERQRKAPMFLKPGQHRTRIRELRSPISYHAKNKIGEIEARDIRGKQA